MEGGEKVGLQRGWPLFQRFWQYLRPERRSAVVIGLLLVVGIPPSIISPLLVRYLFDVVLPQGDASAIVRIAIVVIGLTIVAGLLGYIRSLVSIALRNRVRFRITRDLFAHVLRLPLRYFDRIETGYLMSRVRDDVNGLDSLMVDELVQASVHLVRALIFLGLLLFLDAGLALSGLVLIALILGLVLAVSPELRRRSEVARETDAKSSASLHEAIAGIFTVRTSAQEMREGRRFWSTVKAAIRANARRDVLVLLTGTAFGLLGTLGTYVIVAVGAYRISAGLSTFGNLFAFFLFLMQLLTSTGSVFQLVPEIQRSLASLQRIFDLADEAAEEMDPLAAGEGQVTVLGATSGHPTGLPTSLRGEIELRGVRFRYDSGPLALDRIDLHVQPGEILALVGRSGAGKSTLVHLLPRLYDPSEGEVLLDRRALRTYPLRWLRERIGVVPQDVFLFNRTVRENIGYANPGAITAEIEEAARSAHAHEFIHQLPEGYDTVIGERGVRLSGGEKQRLAIARELLRDPPILIFDEATSQLDSESDALVRDATRLLMQGRTSFVIAHRLSTVLRADRIVVLDRGRIVASGPHAELLAKGGFYSELYELQFGVDGESSELAEP